MHNQPFEFDRFQFRAKISTRTKKKSKSDAFILKAEEEKKRNEFHRNEAEMIFELI